MLIIMKMNLRCILVVMNINHMFQSKKLKVLFNQKTNIKKKNYKIYRIFKWQKAKKI